MAIVRTLCLTLIIGALGCGWSDALIWHTQWADKPGSVGKFSSLDLDGAYRPHIAYYDETNRRLRYARWDGASWRVQTVDGAGNVGKFCSLALDSGDRAHISYFDVSNRALKYARWTGTSWARATVHIDAGEIIGQHTSLTLDDDGHPHISYYHASRQQLWYAEWTGSKWDTDKVDSNDVGQYSSIALDNSGVPHISYYNRDDQELMHAWRSGALWQDETVDTDGAVGRFTSVALDSVGRPRISYYDETNTALKYARFDGSVWVRQTADNSANVGQHTSLVLDGLNRPHVAYYDATARDLKYARWNGAAWEIETVDSGGRVGQYASLQLDANELPHIGYANTRANDLKYSTPAGPWFLFTDQPGYDTDGLRPNKGTANSTRFKFRVIYQDPLGWGPVRPVVILKRNGAVSHVKRLRIADPVPNFALGAELRTGLTLPAGSYTYWFRARSLDDEFARGEPNKERGGLTVTSGATAAVVSVLHATPTAVGAQITVRLASAAAVDATILNIAGRPVRRLLSSRELPAGTNTLLWNACDDTGLAVPSGRYIVAVEARTADGVRARALCPFSIER